MSDPGPVTEESGATALFVAALMALAILLLVLFARGPEDQQRSAAPVAPAVSALVDGGTIS